jgi:hypothetical protein
MTLQPPPATLGVAVGDFDLGLRLMQGAQMRRHYSLARARRGVVVPAAAAPAVLGNLLFVGERFEFNRVGADHQANDVKGTLLVEAVALIISRRLDAYCDLN